MPTGTYSTGPAQFFMGVAANYSPVFFGTTEGEPEWTTDASFEPVNNDIGGHKPIDWQFMGEEGDWSGVFSKYSEAVLRLIEAKTYRATALRGVQPFGSQGAFMGLEGHGFPMWVRFPYITKLAMRALGMPAGMHFPICFAQSTRQSAGTKYRKVHLQIHCQRLFSSANGGTWALYDENMAAVANLPIN